jgi:catechol 2,3-dioxygenase-like lactoylglutathione lyase family enzyme
MFDHIGLKVRDLDASVRFYQAALAPLGYELCSRDAQTAGFGPAGSACLWLHVQAEHGAAAGVHVALRAKERGLVERFYKRGIEAGGRDHGAPGLRADYGPSYFAAFLLDPDGNNLEVLCMR